MSHLPSDLVHSCHGKFQSSIECLKIVQCPNIAIFIFNSDLLYGTALWYRSLPKNSPIDCEGVQPHQYRTTLPVYVFIYTSYNQNSYKECIRIYKYILTQSFWTGTKVIRRKHIIQTIRFGAYSATCYY